MQLGDYVQRLLAHAGVPDAEITVDYNEEAERHWVQIDVSDEDSGVLIGYHGETLAALQRITNLAFYDSKDFSDRITLNINDYREERREKLEALTREKAYHVLETGNPYTFSYMPANERYLVHTFLSEEPDFADLESSSEGRGRQRLLTIHFAQKAEASTEIETTTSSAEATESTESTESSESSSTDSDEDTGTAQAA